MLGLPFAAAAQDAGGASKHLTLIGVPSATVPPNGMVFASLSYATDRSGDAEDDDGSAAVGFGLGDANTTVGLQFNAQITSLTDDFADSGFLEVKASRRVLEGDTPLYLALQASDIAGWGDSSDNDFSLDLILTGFRVLGSGPSATPVMFTLGLGNNVRDGGRESGAYAGLGVGLTESLAASASYYGDYANLGVSYSPKAIPNLSFVASVADVFDSEDERRGVFTINYVIPKAFGG